MKASFLIFFIFVPLVGAPLTAESLLQPGVYKIQPYPTLSVKNLRPETTAYPFEEISYKVFRAIPESAKVTKAIVSLNVESSENKVVFFPTSDYQGDCTAYILRGHAHNEQSLCHAYLDSEQNAPLSISWDDPYLRVRKNEPVASFSGFKFSANALRNAFTVYKSYAATTSTESAAFVEVDEGYKRCDHENSCGDRSFKKDVTHVTVFSYVDSFELADEVPYQDIIFLASQVSVYKTPDTATKITTLQPESYVALLSTTDEWYQVDFFTLKSNPRYKLANGDATQRLFATRGWLNRQDFIKGEWTLQTVTAPQFYFEVAVQEAKIGTGDERQFFPTAIRVVDRETGRTRQSIYDIYWTDVYLTSPKEFLSAVDANFDGHPDLVLRSSAGGAGPNDSKSFFIYDQKAGKFKYDSQLSSLSQIHIDEEGKVITSASRGSCCDSSYDTYKYIKGALTLVSSRNEHFMTDELGQEWLEVSIENLKDGKTSRRTTKKRIQR